MSRDISIGYQEPNSDREMAIELRVPYFLFGCQDTSKRFWSIPKLRELGIARLTELGDGDPIYFIGWDMMDELHREIILLQEHLGTIEFSPELKAQWLSHLVYCYNLLIQTAPRDSLPQLTIG